VRGVDASYAVDFRAICLKEMWWIVCKLGLVLAGDLRRQIGDDPTVKTAGMEWRAHDDDGYPSLRWTKSSRKMTLRPVRLLVGVELRRTLGSTALLCTERIQS